MHTSDSLLKAQPVTRTLERPTDLPSSPPHQISLGSQPFCSPRYNSFSFTAITLYLGLKQIRIARTNQHAQLLKLAELELAIKGNQIALTKAVHFAADRASLNTAAIQLYLSLIDRYWIDLGPHTHQFAQLSRNL